MSARRVGSATGRGYAGGSPGGACEYGRRYTCNRPDRSACRAERCRGCSSLDGDVDGDDAAAQVVVFDLLEADLAQQARQPVLIWKGANRGRQILIDAGGVPGDPGPDPWQQGERIPVVQPAQPACYGARELEADEPPARLQHASDFLESSRQIAHIAEAEAGRDRIEGRVRCREMFRVGLDAEDLALQASGAHLLQPDGQHRAVEVYRYDPCVLTQ